MTTHLKKWLTVTAFTPIMSLAFIFLAAAILLVPLAAIIWPNILLPLEDTHESK